MKRILLALAILIATCLGAQAQSPVTVIGPITPGDCVIFNSNTVLKDAGTTCNQGGIAIPGGVNGSIQYNNGGTFGGFVMNGDCLTNTSTGVIICAKTNGVSFGIFATATAAVATAALNPCTATLSGIVPTPPNNTTTFLRGDCTFAAVPNPGKTLYKVTASPYNVVGNYNLSATAAMNSGSTTITNLSNLTSGNIGNYIAVAGAGASGVTLYTTIASITNSTTAVLATGNTSGSAISGKFAEWGTDSAPGIQAAWNACLAGGGGSVYIPHGYYFMSQLNMTNANASCAIEGDGVNSTTIFPLQIAAYTTSHGHMFDMAGSSFIGIRNIQIGAYYTLAQPQTAIFMAQVSGSSNRMFLEHIYISGSFVSSTFYDYGVPSLYMIYDVDFYNYLGVGYTGTLYLSGTNTLGLTSGFVTVSTGTQSASDIMFAQCEFHRQGNFSNGEVVYFDNIGNVSFYSGVITGGAQYYVLLSGSNGPLSFHNVTFETESFPTPLFVYNVSAGMTISSLDDVGSSYITVTGKFSSGVTTTNSVQYSK